jgi:citrate lyase subunit beta / citryl-CoA lyase
MSGGITSTGNAGPKVRSDCEITLVLKKSGGVKIGLESKVKALYGSSITEQCRQILEYFGIRHAEVAIRDSGALPFVISARIEAAIRKQVKTNLEFLPEMLKENTYATSASRTRFSRLYIPGNTPSMMINAGLHSADGIILDLEDSVAPERKDDARFLVRNALRQIQYNGAERMVRINQGEAGLIDLKFIIPHNVNLVLIPKCEDGSQVKAVEAEIEKLKKTSGVKNPVFLMPIIESALGVENAFEIVRASGSVVAVAIGLEDYASDLGVARSLEGMESFYARTRLVVAAKAAGIQAIDSVFSDVADMEALRQNVASSKALGFEGMGCIHPRQVPVINDGFAPGMEEIEKARKIVLAFEAASKNGLGVVALGSKMIDKPVVTRALKCIDLAVKLGKLQENWRDEAPAGNEK